MLVECWATVADGGPTLNQHCVHVFVFAGTACYLSTVKHLTNAVPAADHGSSQMAQQWDAMSDVTGKTNVVHRSS